MNGKKPPPPATTNRMEEKTQLTHQSHKRIVHNSEIEWDGPEQQQKKIGPEATTTGNDVPHKQLLHHRFAFLGVGMGVCECAFAWRRETQI